MSQIPRADPSVLLQASVVHIHPDAYIDSMQDLPSDRDALQALLDFHVEAGVDLALDETPHNRFAEPKAERAPAKAPAQASASKASPSPASAPSPRALPKAAAGAPEEVANMAREQARHAQSLAELEAILAGFDGCTLKFSAKNLAFADGNPEGRVMLVGEAPGADEDREGLPFVGRSGKLLDRMLSAIGLDRTSVYIANIIPWRPPGNRTPTPQESQICLPFIQRQIELADPDILVCLGGPSAQTLLGIRDGITRIRGRWFPFDTGKREIRAMPTFHPAFLLRSPLQKRFAWRDFLAIKRALAG